MITAMREAMTSAAALKAQKHHLPKSRIAFSLVYVPHTTYGPARQVCRYECSNTDCAETIDYAPKSNRQINATDAHRKWLGNHGWLLSGNATTATCPTCIRAKKIKKPEEAPPVEEVTVEAAPVEPVKRRGRPPGAKNRPKEEPVVSVEALTVEPVVTELAPVELPPVEPTLVELAPVEAPAVALVAAHPSAEERLKIRFALDQNFDDKAGEYLENQSDDTIAQALSLPAGWVETIREIAYGPLRPPRAELAAVRQQLTALGEQLQAALAQLDKLERKIGDVTSLGS